MKKQLHASLTYVHVAFLALISATQKLGHKSTRAQKMQNTPDTHQHTVHPAAGGGGRAGCRLDHGARVGVEEWVGRYAQCFRARGVQRIRCCNRIRKLACERASRWKTAWRSSAKLEQAAASSPIDAVQILSNSWINRKPLCVYCSTVIARNSLLIAVFLVSGWYWEHVSVCEAGGQLGKWSSVCLTGWTAAFTCVLTEPFQSPASCHVESKTRWLLICRTHSRLQCINSRTSTF